MSLNFSRENARSPVQSKNIEERINLRKYYKLEIKTLDDFIKYINTIFYLNTENIYFFSFRLHQNL